MTTVHTKEKEIENEAGKVKDSWAIRPCFMYQEEYSECTSFKARFHQYFIHGDLTDCSQWQTDYKNCLRYQEREEHSKEAGDAVVASEQNRRDVRLKAHYANDIWTKRKSPPGDWNKPLPEWLEKKNEGTFLYFKAKELKGNPSSKEDDTSFCILM